MPRKSLHGRTCGVSRDGGRARALQPSCKSSALQLIYPHCPGSRSTTPKQSRLRTVVMFRRDQRREPRAL
ncbi:hypothetical protein XarbCFBP8150_21115 [Xanthomonas arboricola]|nr:hypothetical protein XarbCFBP8150_21115 [Xanthomonas arboricola]PPT59894.1 hypothetical protein XarbCFBP8153_05570 [Xanthomonas arboricola]